VTEPQTPASAENLLQHFSDQLEEARQMLGKARNAEVEAEHAWKAAKRMARFSDARPKVGVFDGVRTTVADLEAWIEEQCAAEELRYQLAKMTRQAAAEHLRTLREQGSLQQTISKSVADSYRGTRTGERW
jgi:hypothetical protein